MYKLFSYSLIKIFVFVVFTPGTIAQEENGCINFSDDSLFMEARNLAFSGKFDKARNVALLLLDRNPLHHDASVLIARLYAWEKKYDSARVYIQNVTDHYPGYYDALSAMTDIEIWDGNHVKAIETAKIALSFHHDNEEFLFKKAMAYSLKGSISEAEEILHYLLEVNPDNEEAMELLRSLSTPGFYYYRENNYLLAGYYGEFFEKPYARRMHMGSAGYSHYARWGPLTGKINFANTFIDGTGLTRYPSLQYEIESYPQLSPDAYLLLNYAYSRGLVFPDHRGAFEYFRNLPGGFEASLGLRILLWNKTYLFYTGSVGKYYGDLWFSFRPYIFPGNNGVSGSWYLNARKYYNSADDYAGIIIGFGLSPDEILSDPEDRIFLNATSVGIEFSKGLGSDFMIRSSLRYEYEEYSVDYYRNRWIVNLSLRYYL